MICDEHEIARRVASVDAAGSVGYDKRADPKLAGEKDRKEHGLNVPRFVEMQAAFECKNRDSSLPREDERAFVTLNRGARIVGNIRGIQN